MQLKIFDREGLRRDHVKISEGSRKNFATVFPEIALTFRKGSGKNRTGLRGDHIKLSTSMCAENREIVLSESGKLSNMARAGKNLPRREKTSAGAQRPPAARKNLRQRGNPEREI